MLTNELAAPAYTILKHDELDQLSMTFAQVPVGKLLRQQFCPCRASHGHHLRRHPDHDLTGGQQVPLEPGRQVLAILDRPARGRRRTVPPPT